jgi:nucleoside-diphosphate-sugar epimerase
MKVLVTGGAGFIGSRVVEQLAAREDVQTTVLVRSSTDLFRLHRLGLLDNPQRVRLAVGDFCRARQRDAVLRQLRPEVVIHLAMVYHTLGSAGTADVDAVNRQGTISLFGAFMAAGGRRFVSAGTCFEYGHQPEAPVSEDAPCRPIYDYARAKAAAAEALLARGATAGIEALVLRVFAPYGPLEDPKRIVPQLLNAGLEGGQLELTEGQQVRDYVFVEEVSRAFLAAALHPRPPRAQAVYNVCTGVGHSLRQLAATAEQALGRPLPLSWGAVPYRPNEMMHLVGNPERMAAELGWRAGCPLAEGLRRTLPGLRRRAPARSAADSRTSA